MPLAPSACGRAPWSHRACPAGHLIQPSARIKGTGECCGGSHVLPCVSLASSSRRNAAPSVSCSHAFSDSHEPSPEPQPSSSSSSTSSSSSNTSPPTGSTDLPGLLCSMTDEVTASRCLKLAPELATASPARASIVIQRLRAIGVDAGLATVFLKHPNLLMCQPERMEEAELFLREDLGVAGDELVSLVERFPHVLSYPVKAHLRPHLAYLGSFGVEDVRGLVLERPHVLGEGIESVCKFLCVCRMPRREVFRLLRSYPLDYCLKLKSPVSVANIQAEGLVDDGDASEF